MLEEKTRTKLPEEWQHWYEGKAFTTDWTSGRLRRWSEMLENFVGQSPDVLEIGSWEGRSAIFFAEFLKPARLTCVDTFGGGAEHQGSSTLSGIEVRFDANTAAYASLEKKKMRSIEALDQFVREGRRYDVIYVDGSHDMDDALIDSVLCWRLLKVGGVIIWDDYKWSAGMKRAIDLFLAYRGGEYQLLDRGWQVAARRTAPSPAHYERQETSVA
jgi:cephalosporin hydroxylase